MRLGTHVTGGVLAYTATATLFQLPWTATGVVVAAAASAAPDVDTLGSTVGRVFAPLARRVERRFGHRTLTHCYAFQAAVAVLALPLVAAGQPHLYAALVVGYASHPFLDTLTVQGVRVWWPWSDRRGVFPYYNRQPTAYRTKTGSRADSFFGTLFLVATVPLAVVQHDGYPRLVRRVQADAGAAVRDFLDWSADGYLVSVDIEADDPQTVRTLSGTFDAIGTTGQNTLLVRDSTGQTFSLGPAYAADFQPTRAVAHRGARVVVSRRRIDLAGRVLADLDGLVPTVPGGQRARHLLDGQVTLAEPASVTPDEFRFDTVEGTDRRLSLRFATIADLERLDLTGVVVETGVVTVRVYLAPGQAEGYAPDPGARSTVRRVTFAHPPSEPPRVLVAEGDAVAIGDTVAVLRTAALATARLDAQEAQADLAAARSSNAVPASAEHAVLRQRLADAQAQARRVAERHAAGFEPSAAVAAARADADDLQAQLDQAQAAANARHATAQAARTERVREATARLRRARLRLDRADRDATVRSTGAGVVRRIERRETSPDRTEVRVVLTAPRTPSPTDAASQNP